MSCCIPEIRVYSPGEQTDSNEKDLLSKANNLNEIKKEDNLNGTSIKKISWKNTFHMRYLH